MGFFNNIDNIPVGTCVLSKDRKTLSVWSNDRWLTVTASLGLINKPRVHTDKRNHKKYIYNESLKEWDSLQIPELQKKEK